MSSEYIGRGSIGVLGDLLQTIKVRRVILFSRESLVTRYSSLLGTFFSFWTPYLYKDCPPNPGLDDVKRALTFCSGVAYDAIVAVGGGSVIDLSKLFRFWSGRRVPLIAIPTTAGTGSESTRFAVYYVDGIKRSLDSPDVKPDFSIVDSQFLDGAPRYLKACSSADAFCQSVESYWSVRSTDVSKRYAWEAASLIKDSIVAFVNYGDVESADRLSKGAHLAGKAIDISRTTAAHALSYAFTHQLNIPHGHAVALSMADVFESNLSALATDCQDPRGIDYIRDVMRSLSSLILPHGVKFREYWTELMASIGLEMNCSLLGMLNKKKIIMSVNRERLANNPVDLGSKLENFFEL